MGIKLVFGPQSEELLDGVSLVVVSPAVPARIPLIQEAYKRHIRVASEVELGYQLKKAPICAVTGTNGKTTTVTLLGLLLETHFNKVGVGGNIGVPLSEVALTIPADGCIAAEISSYQMEVTEEFRPHVATVLNVTPDHIVRHGSMEEYQRMKERMFAQQKSKISSCSTMMMNGLGIWPNEPAPMWFISAGRCICSRGHIWKMIC